MQDENTIYFLTFTTLRIKIQNEIASSEAVSFYVDNVSLKTHDAIVAVSATDYYPFGMPMPNRKIVNGEPYRYAYQGQEIDTETGKEAFQLRLWDSRIGRWLTTDPKHEFSSPYLGMGNNPINGVDPDGGYRNWFQAAAAWVAFGGQGRIARIGGEGNRNYAIQLGRTIDEGNGTQGVELFNTFGSDNITSDVWNAPITRVLTPDAFSLKGSLNFNVYKGKSLNFEAIIQTRGKEASVIPKFAIGYGNSLGTTVGSSASIGVTVKNYNGSVENISTLDLLGASRGFEIAVQGISIDYDVAYTGDKTTWTSAGVSFEAGARASGIPIFPVDVNESQSKTMLLIHNNLQTITTYDNKTGKTVHRFTANSCGCN